MYSLTQLNTGNSFKEYQNHFSFEFSKMDTLNLSKVIKTCILWMKIFKLLKYDKIQAAHKKWHCSISTIHNFDD